jgi:pentatricopeptide repeat protein
MSPSLITPHVLNPRSNAATVEPISAVHSVLDGSCGSYVRTIVSHPNSPMEPRATAATTRHLKQLRAHLLRRGHPLPPAPHPDPDRAHLSVLRSAASPRLALAACACLRGAGMPPPGRPALPALLRAAALYEGDSTAFVERLHGLAVRVGVQDDSFVGTALVGAYASLGRVADARRVFNEMTARDTVAWGVMLDG